ncbi:MAG TPA: RNA 2',3'-cyclic phosphodiesterase [Anaeromyxobacteraceae bacterium]|nr:RNA 2',3'-cyclic phosphodiesterase [Anaeromyxobacteraceae bacterium]
MNLRLFVALAPPPPVRRKLAAAQDRLRREAGRHAADVRWVDPSNIHLTLQFLGAVPEERLAAIRDAVAAVAAASRPLRLELRGAGGFPSARRPRVVFTSLAGDVEALARLVSDLGRQLGQLGFPPEERPFSPHLTQGRARDGRGAPGLGGALAAAASDEPVPWRAEEVVLFRSHLSPAGARYEALDRWRLGPAGP